MYDVPRAYPKVTRLWLWWATTYLLAALISALVARLVVTWRCAGGCGAVVYHFEGYTLPTQLKSARGVGFLVAALVFSLSVTLGLGLMSRLVIWQVPRSAWFGGWVALSASASLMAWSIGFVVVGNNADAHPAVVGPLILCLVLFFFTLPLMYGAGRLYGKAFDVEMPQLGPWSRRYAGLSACAWLIFVVAASLCGPEDITLAYVGWAVAWSLFGLVSGGLLLPLLAPRT